MFSILQILKKHQEEKQKLRQTKNPSVIDQMQPSSEEPEQKKTQTDAGTAPVNISVFAAVTREMEEERQKHTQEVYCAAVSWAKKIYSLEITTQDEFKTVFLPFADEAVNAYKINDKDFLYHCLVDYGDEPEYIYRHAVNVSFLSLELGRGMNYAHNRLRELFCAAFMHDIGIMPYAELINKRAVLGPDEFARVKEHPARGVDILNQLGGEFSAGIIDVISQEHERMDGSGYPSGLSDGKISEFAQIVALADTYEALTHTRPHRSKLTPPKAMNEILDRKKLFNMDVLKQLLERIGIFPVGAWVRLNTKETGVVARNNHGLPLRPVVQVLFAENGTKLMQPKTVDLASNLLISIEECLEGQYTPR